MAQPVSPVDDDGGNTRSGGRSGSSLVVTIGGGTVVGLLIVILFSISRHPFWEVLATSAMFGAASMAAGGLFGLLFGVPRSTATGQQPLDPNAPGLGGIAANTNLEQISDWLTKIIVGVTLTQLVTIKDGAARLFATMAPLLGGPPDGAAFAGAVVIYFSVLGFFTGWLYARLRLGLEMSSADALMGVSQRARKRGDTKTAEVADERAAAIIGASAGGSPAAPGGAPSLLELAARYAQLRGTLAPGTARTARMEDLVRQVRRLGASEPFTVQDVQGLFQTGDEGSRIVALGLMQADLACADLPSVLDAIGNPRSAFEQYQALRVASQLVPTLNLADRQKLRETLTSDATQQKIGGDTSRTELSQSILSRLADLEDR